MPPLLPESLPILLLTRPERESVDLAERVRTACDVPHRTVISPLIAVEQVGERVELSGMHALIFTSANGVRLARWAEPVRDMPAYCVGARTAEAARDAGFDAVSADGSAEDLLTLILSDPPAGPMLHVRGEETRGNVVERLREAGVQARSAVVYRQVPQPLNFAARDVLSGQELVIAPVFSPNTARVLTAQGPYQATLETIAISDAVEAEMEGLSRSSSCVVERPNQAEMLAAICRCLRGN